MARWDVGSPRWSIRRCARAYRIHGSAICHQRLVELDTACGCGLSLSANTSFLRNKRRHRHQLGSSGRPDGRLCPNRPVVAWWTAAVFRPVSLVCAVFSGQLGSLRVRIEAEPVEWGAVAWVVWIPVLAGASRQPRTR